MMTLGVAISRNLLDDDSSVRKIKSEVKNAVRQIQRICKERGRKADEKVVLKIFLFEEGLENREDKILLKKRLRKLFSEEVNFLFYKDVGEKEERKVESALRECDGFLSIWDGDNYKEVLPCSVAKKMGIREGGGYNLYGSFGVGGVFFLSPFAFERYLFYTGEGRRTFFGEALNKDVVFLAIEEGKGWNFNERNNSNIFFPSRVKIRDEGKLFLTAFIPRISYVVNEAYSRKRVNVFIADFFRRGFAFQKGVKGEKGEKSLLLSEFEEKSGNYKLIICVKTPDRSKDKEGKSTSIDSWKESVSENIKWILKEFYPDRNLKHLLEKNAVFLGFTDEEKRALEKGLGVKINEGIRKRLEEGKREGKKKGILESGDKKAEDRKIKKKRDKRKKKR